MQERHLNRRQYFQEQANTAQEFYMDYLRPFMGFGSTTRVLEIGCGEGGNLLPFAEAGCQVTGIDISQLRINGAQQFFSENHQRGAFLCKNFMLAEKPKTDAERLQPHQILREAGRYCVLWFPCMAEPFRRTSADMHGLCLEASLHPLAARFVLSRNTPAERCFSAYHQRADEHPPFTNVCGAV